MTYFHDLIKTSNNEYKYYIKFSDNPFYMVFTHIDILECLKVKHILNQRITDFISKKSNELKTSDLNFKYLKSFIR